MPSGTFLTLKNEKVNIEHQLLFQSLIILRERVDNLISVFKYELCSFYPTLYESFLMPHQAKKPDFATAVWDKVSAEQT